MAFPQRYLIAALGLLLALLPASLLGAEAPARLPIAGDENVRIIRFYYVSFAKTDDLQADPICEFLLRNGKDTVRPKLSANGFSSAIPYQGPVPVSLFRERSTPTGIERENLGLLDFPAAWKGVLFLVMHDPATPRLPFRFRAIEYWGPSLPDRHVRILNLCPSPLGASIGGVQAAVAAGETADLALAGGGSDVSLRLALQNKDRWEMLLSTAIAPPVRNRLLLLTFPKPAGGARVLMLDDLPQPQPAP